MGKSKKRIFNRNTDEKGILLKRNKAVQNVLESIHSNNITEETKKLICLFGISSEELLEAGAEFEDISAFQNLFI